MDYQLSKDGPINILRLTDSQLELIRQALQAHRNALLLQSRHNPEPSAEAYYETTMLLGTINSFKDNFPGHNFGEFAPMECEVDGEEIIDRDRAVVLPNFGYAHDDTCAHQWHVMEEAK